KVASCDLAAAKRPVVASHGRKKSQECSVENPHSRAKPTFSAIRTVCTVATTRKSPNGFCRRRMGLANGDGMCSIALSRVTWRCRVLGMAAGDRRMAACMLPPVADFGLGEPAVGCVFFEVAVAIWSDRGGGVPPVFDFAGDGGRFVDDDW